MNSVGDTRDLRARDEAARNFQKSAAARSGNLFGEVWGFLRANKKWWLLPIVVILVAVGALLVFAHGSVLAPFIYTIF